MNRIKELRTENGLLQKDIEKKMNLGRGSISRLEKELIALTPETITPLCDIFGCTADYLLGISSRRESAVTEPDAELLAAYHSAPAEIRTIVDTALQPYREKKITAAG